jgi:hypothetical protein
MGPSIQPDEVTLGPEQQLILVRGGVVVRLVLSKASPRAALLTNPNSADVGQDHVPEVASRAIDEVNHAIFGRIFQVTDNICVGHGRASVCAGHFNRTRGGFREHRIEELDLPLVSVVYFYPAFTTTHDRDVLQANVATFD